MNELSSGNGTRTAGVGRSFDFQNPKVVVLFLAVVVLAAYLPTLSYPFVFDDIPELLHNPDVLRFRDCLETISRSQNTGLSGRPVACLTLAANVAVSGFSVRGFHIVNIAIHLLAALTLFGIVRRTLEPVRGSQSGNSAAFTAGVIAALWALHPLQTESVTYIIQRIESLAGLFYLLTLYCAIRAAPGASLFWPVFSVLSCAFGMLTKEIVVTAPIVVYLYDIVFRSRGRAWHPKPLHLALAVTWIIPAILISQSPRGGSAGFGLGVTAMDYLRTQAQVIVHYLRLVFWPFPQAISYSDWPIVREWSPAIIPGIFVLGMLAITAVGLTKRQWWGFCGAWFFLILAPSSSIVPIVTEPAAERRMYLPLAGVVVMIVIGLGIFLTNGRAAAWTTTRSRRCAGVVAAIVAVTAVSSATIARNREFKTAVTILASTLEARPGDELIRATLVDELIGAGRVGEARQMYEAGVARNPDAYILHDSWARSMNSVGRREEAIVAFSKAIEIRPQYAPSRAGLGVSLLESGRDEDALIYLREAIRLAPNAYSARGNLAVALAHLGRTNEAIQELQSAVAIKPNFADGHYNLASLLAAQGKNAEAREHFREAAALRPNDLEMQQAWDAAKHMQEPKQGASDR